MQFGHHPRAVGSGVLAENENRVGVLEIIEHDGSLADPDRFRKADAGRLMTHIRAIRKVVRAVKPRKQLIKERRFVGGSARGIEFRLVRIGESAQLPPDQRESLVPGHRDIPVGTGIVPHRLRQPALFLQPVIALPLQFADRPGREELPRDPLLGRLPSDGFGAVLAEFEGAGVLRVWPGAARTIEPVRLVHRQKRFSALEDRAFLAQCLGCGMQCAPAAGRRIIRLEYRLL